MSTRTISIFSTCARQVDYFPDIGSRVITNTASKI
jgi:hypothetical protein